MKRCSIIIHSENGNNYIIGNYFKEELEKHKFDVRYYRVEDKDLHILANNNEMVNQYYEDILSLPSASPSIIEKSDLIILGSPVRFSNVTAEMKDFMDLSLPYVENKKFANKFFACFVSGCSEDNSLKALNSMIFWASELSMKHISFSGNIKEGLIHLSGNEGKIRPSEILGHQIEEYASILQKELYK